MVGSFDDLLEVEAVSQNDEKAAFVAESRNNRNRCYEMMEQMTQEVSADGGAFQRYLDTQSRFDRYTTTNVLLIMSQRPDARKIGAYGYWRDQGGYVRRQESPLLILEPGKQYVREDGTTGTYYNAKKVFDISQTTLGSMLPQEPDGKVGNRELLKALVSNPPASIRVLTQEQLQEHPVPEDRGAEFSLEDNCIYVRAGMQAHEIFRSLVPELVHAGFADGNSEYRREDYAFHAYCASYMLCQKYSVDAGDYDFSHATEYFEGMEPQEVRAELKQVRESANAISARMEKVLAPIRNPSRQEEPQENRTEQQRQNPEGQQQSGQRPQLQPEQEPQQSSQPQAGQGSQPQAGQRLQPQAGQRLQLQAGQRTQLQSGLRPQPQRNWEAGR